MNPRPVLSQLGRPSVNSLPDLSWLCMLSVLSQFSVGPSFYYGFLLCRGGPLLHLFCLLRCGGLLPCLLRTGGLQLRRGCLLPCLLCTGGLLLCLLRRGGLLPHLLRRGGHLLRRGGWLSGSGGLLLCSGGLLLRLLCRGGPQFHLYCRFCPGFLVCRLHPGSLFLSILLCLIHQSLHSHMDLALQPSPCSASAPPPSGEHLEADSLGGRDLGGFMNLVHGLLSDCHKRSPLQHIYSYTTDCYTSHWTEFPIIHCTDHTAVTNHTLT